MRRLLRSRADYRQTILRNQLTSLIEHEAITTTEAKAKMLVPFAEKFFYRVSASDMNAKRYAHQLLLSEATVNKTFDDILKRRNTVGKSFVRRIKMVERAGDGAKQALVQLLVADKATPVTSEPKPAKKAEAKK